MTGGVGDTSSMNAEPASVQWGEVLGTLVAGEHLPEDVCRQVMAAIVSGGATEAQIAAFAVALRAKGETAEEVSGLVSAMLDASVPLPIDSQALDVVGTGGDLAHTVNVSTIAALVAAGAGAVVVKHGNRAATSKCGSADVLEALGVRIDLPPAGVAECVGEVGIGFCFAPVFHPAMRYAGSPRRQIGIPTVFNILGPLSNPAQPSASLIGAADARLAPVMAEVLAARNRRAAVVRGADGLDEITIGGYSDIWETTATGVRPARVEPTLLGLPHNDVRDLRGGDAQFNAQVLRDVLDGHTDGPLASVREAVLLNAAAALVVWDAACGLGAYGVADERFHIRLQRALPVAAESVAGGAARAVLERWITVSTRLGQ